MYRILVVEDEKDIVSNLEILLGKEGFSVAAAFSREDAVKMTEQESFDLVLLDLNLPDGNGYSLCTLLKKDRDIPVIMLTASDDESSIVTGFSVGADDYVVKPFKPLELVSRIKNVLRRCGKASPVIRIDDLEVDALKASVSRGGEEILLSALEYRLLLVFLNHRGEVLSRTRLLEEIWDAAGDFVNDNTLTVYIKRLREKIEKDPAVPEIIKTVRGLGYKVGD